VDGGGIPVGFVTAPANRHDSPLLAETLDAAAEALGGLPEATSIHLDRGYDSDTTHGRLRERGLVAEISKKGKPAPLTATKRWVVERSGSWQAKLAHKSFYEKAIPVKPTWRLWSSSEKGDVRALTRASIRTVVGSASR